MSFRVETRFNGRRDTCRLVGFCIDCKQTLAVLYMSKSPDGKFLISGAQETLAWKFTNRAANYHHCDPGAKHFEPNPTVVK